MLLFKLMPSLDVETSGVDAIEDRHVELRLESYSNDFLVGVRWTFS